MKRKTPFSPVTVKVRCRGRLHTIRLTARGRLQFPDHDLRREQALAALGGVECRCMEVLRIWQGYHTCGTQRGQIFTGKVLMPRKMLPAYEAQWAQSRERYSQKPTNPDLLLREFYARHTRKTCAAAVRALGRCGYTRQIAIARQHQIFVCRYGDDASYAVSHEPCASDDSLADIWRLVVPKFWYYRVYRQNLAVIDSHFVFQVVSRDPLRVVAMRQTGMKPELCYGTVLPAVTGHVLHWDS